MVDILQVIFPCSFPVIPGLLLVSEFPVRPKKNQADHTLFPVSQEPLLVTQVLEPVTFPSPGSHSEAKGRSDLAPSVGMYAGFAGDRSILNCWHMPHPWT